MDIQRSGTIESVDINEIEQLLGHYVLLVARMSKTIAKLREELEKK